MAARPEEILNDSVVNITINGKNIKAYSGDTILDVTKRENIEIPHLCFKEGMRPDGNCRACMVEIEGERALQPSCVRTVMDGMIINTENNRVKHSQKLVLELLTSDVSEKVYFKENELTLWSKKLNIKEKRFPVMI